MKSTIHIETHTIPAYRAIRPALVAANVGYLGVSGLTISANHAAQSAGIPRDEYDIKTVHAISR